MKAGTRCSSATAPTIPNALPTLSAAAGGIAPKRGSGRRSAIGPDLLWLVGAALFAGAAPVAAQAPKPAAELARAWAAGYRPAFTCSSLWNGAGKPLEAIERDDLTGLYPDTEDDARHPRGGD